jgi:hypothetical protein
MVKNISMAIGCRKMLLVLVLAVFFCGLPEPAYCETTGPVLLLQQTPENGGTITPGIGVHHIELNSSVTLTAVPKPGYQFVYWLGDVSNPTLQQTTAYLSAPKIIVAVFERTEYELDGEAELLHITPGGFWGRLRASAADYARQGFRGGGGRRPGRPPARPPAPEPPLPPGEIPVPIPEPATVVLLGLGGFLALAVRKDSHGGRRPKK